MSDETNGGRHRNRGTRIVVWLTCLTGLAAVTGGLRWLMIRGDLTGVEHRLGVWLEICLLLLIAAVPLAVWDVGYGREIRFGYAGPRSRRLIRAFAGCVSLAVVLTVLYSTYNYVVSTEVFTGPVAWDRLWLLAVLVCGGYIFAESLAAVGKGLVSFLIGVGDFLVAASTGQITGEGDPNQQRT